MGNLSPSVSTARAKPAWARHLAYRFRIHLLLKLVGVSAFVGGFFYAYFALLRRPSASVTEMPLLALDHWVSFQPAWLAVYLSLWVYVGIVPGLMVTRRELILYGAWATAMCGVGLACFYLWPTVIPNMVGDTQGHGGFALLKGIDARGNACPSMHVAAAVFAAVGVERLLRHEGAPSVLRLLNLLWGLGIAYSTLAVKQHVALDAAAGLVLGLGFALSVQRWGPPLAVVPRSLA